MNKQDVEKLIEEVKAIKQREELTKKQRIAIEQRIFKELPQKCVKCPNTNNLTLDHIISVYLLRNFNIDVEREVIPGNYRVLCRACNQLKGLNLDFSAPETKVLLLRLLEKVN